MNLIDSLKKYSEEIVLGFVLLTGAVLRFHHLGFTSLSNDELSAITRAQHDSFSAMIRNGVMIDFHPAGVEAFMYYWMKFFGDNVFIIRFPFAVAGILSIFMLYLLAARWFNKTTALFAAAALSTLAFPLLYTQLARPYAFGLLFILAAAYFWTRILFPRENEPISGRQKKLLIAGFILSMSACTHTHYFALMLAGIIGVSGFFFLRKTNYKSYLISGILILLLFIPEIPVFSAQMSIGGLAWLSKPDESFFRGFINYCFNDSDFIFYLFITTMVSSFIYFRKRLELTKFHWLCILWFLIPFFIGYYYSVLRSPVLQYSTLLFGFPFLLMFIFSFIPDNAFRKNTVLIAVILFTLTVSYNTVKVKLYYWTHHFGVFKEIAEDAVKWTDTYGEDKITKVITVINPKYIDYYFDKMGHKMKIDFYKMEDESDLARLIAVVNNSSKTYLLYGWSNIWHPQEALQIIMKKFPLLIERDTFFNSSISLFKRDANAELSKSFLQFSTDYETDHWGEETKARTDELAHSGTYSEKLDAGKEYSISYKIKLVDLYPDGNRTVTASVWFNSKEATTDAKLVLEFVSGGKSFGWNAADLKSFNLKPGEWQQAIVSRPLPEMNAVDDIVKVYVWNSGKKTFYIDDFEVRIEKQMNQ